MGAPGSLGAALREGRLIRVYVSSVIDASADNVWSRIRDFNALPLWHPAIADSRIENNEPADRVGCIRHFHPRDGGMIRERLLALSDYDYSCSYEILESPMGVTEYVATLKLTPITRLSPLVLALLVAACATAPSGPP